MEVAVRYLLSKDKATPKWEPPFTFNWSNQKLWALNLPVQNLHIKRLSWIALRPIWSTRKGMDLRNLVPYDVIHFPELHPKRYKRILEANLQYPIDCVWIKGRYYILDGVHRLAKHLINQTQIVQVRMVKAKHIDQIMV